MRLPNAITKLAESMKIWRTNQPVVLPKGKPVFNPRILDSITVKPMKITVVRTFVREESCEIDVSVPPYASAIEEAEYIQQHRDTINQQIQSLVPEDFKEQSNNTTTDVFNGKTDITHIIQPS